MTLQSLLSAHLYHELTTALQQQLALTESQGDRLTLFRSFALPGVSHLNQLAVVQMLRELIKQGTDDVVSVLAIIEEISAVITDKTALFQLDVVKAECAFRSEGASEEVRRQLAQLEDCVDEQTKWRSIAEYSRLQVLVGKSVGDLERVYESGIRLVNVSPFEADIAGWMVRDIARAGLLSERVFDLGGLLGEGEKVKKVLGEKDGEGLLEVLRAFDGGEVAKFEQTMHRSDFTKEEIRVLEQKIKLMALLRLCGKAKKVSFEQVAQTVGVVEVEELVLKALGGELMKGAIDEVQKIVKVDWVRPRILDVKKIRELKTGFDTWKGRLVENFD